MTIVVSRRALKGCVLCGKKLKSREYCNTHYACFKRTGNPLPQIKKPIIAFDDGTALCSECGERKPFAKFKPQSNGKGKYGIYSICNQCCYQRYQKPKALERYEWIDAYKMERGCVDCGYNKHPHALDFDHLPGTEKLAGIGSGWAGSAPWDKVLAEIEKCEIVCANCHRIRTHERRKEVMSMSTQQTSLEQNV